MQTIQGTIVKFLPITEGDSAKGHWRKAGFVIETEGQYPQKVAFIVFGDEKINQFVGFKEGMQVQVEYIPQSREFNDRWYTDLNCIRISQATQQQPATQQANPFNTAAQQVAQPARSRKAEMTNENLNNEGNDDLPF